MRQTLGIIRTGKTDGVALGHLTHDDAHHHTLVALDISALVPICRKTDNERLNAYCIPDIAIDHPPYIDPCDMQICGAKDKRTNIGYVWSMDSPAGEVIYQVRFDVRAVLKAWGVCFIHCHVPTAEEIEARMSESPCETSKG